jgi:hypothetical protein
MKKKKFTQNFNGKASWKEKMKNPKVQLGG